jgi:hypothetical protein
MSETECKQLQWLLRDISRFLEITKELAAVRAPSSEIHPYTDRCKRSSWKEIWLVQSPARQHATAKGRRGGGGGGGQPGGADSQGEHKSRGNWQRGERTARRLRAISHSEKVDSQEKETAKGRKHQGETNGRGERTTRGSRHSFRESRQPGEWDSQGRKL